MKIHQEEKNLIREVQPNINQLNLPSTHSNRIQVGSEVAN